MRLVWRGQPWEHDLDPHQLRGDTPLSWEAPCSRSQLDGKRVVPGVQSDAVSTIATWPPAEVVPWPARVLVVDTNYLARMAWSAADRADFPTDLEHSLAGRVTVHAGAHVPGEMTRRIPKLHPRRDPAPAMRAWSDRLAPQLRIVDLAPRWQMEPFALEVARLDPDDQPTAALAAYLAPCLLLTTDGVFDKVGLEVAADPRAVVVAAGEAAEVEGTAAAAVVFGVLLAQLLAHLAAHGLRSGRAHPAITTAVLGLSAGALLALDRQRPGSTRSAAVAAGRTVRASAQVALSAAETLRLAHEQAVKQLVEVRRARPHTLSEAAAAILARHGRPMSVDDLRARLAAPRGYGRLAPRYCDRPTLTAALREDPAFTHDHRGWALGANPTRPQS